MFADLVRHGRIALLGTHDLIAHVAGVRREAWQGLQIDADRVYRTIRRYFQGTALPSVASLILPYTAGVVLDDLAQPPTYGSRSHRLALELLLAELDKNSIPSHLPRVLSKFPPQFEKVIEASRNPNVSRNELKGLVSGMITEIQKASLRTSVTFPKMPSRNQSRESS